MMSPNSKKSMKNYSLDIRVEVRVGVGGTFPWETGVDGGGGTDL